MPVNEFKDACAKANFFVLREGVMAIEFSGLLTRRSLISLLSQSMEAGADGGGSLVVRYDKSVPLLDVDDLLAAVSSYKPGACMNVALVVPVESVEMFRSFAWMAGRSGYLRGVFTSPRRAQVWAQRHVGLEPSLMGQIPA